jgi:hypothetical protein
MLANIQRYSLILLSVIFLVSSLYVPQSAQAQTVPLIDPISQIHTQLGQIVIGGSYAYISAVHNGQNELSVYDINVKPYRVSGVALPGATQVMTRLGSVVYVVVAPPSGARQIVAVDVSNPYSPTIRSSYTFPNTAIQPTSIYARGSRLFTAGGDGGLHMINISNPSAISYDKILTPHGKSVSGYGNYLATASHSSNTLLVFDISDPANPKQVRSTTAQATQIFLQDQTLFALDNEQVLRSDLLKDNAQSQIANTLAARTFAAVSTANRLYVLSAPSGVHVFDITNNKLDYLSTYIVHNAYSLAVQNNRLFVVSSSGITVLDVSQVSGLKAVAKNAIPANAKIKATAFNGQHVYTAETVGGVQNASKLSIYELNQGALNLINTISGFQDISALTVAGTTLYVGDQDTLTLFDILNPAVANKLGTIKLANAAINQIAVEGKRAYILGRGFRVIDISNPANLSEVQSLLLDKQVNDIEIMANYAILAVENAGLHSVNLDTWEIDARYQVQTQGSTTITRIHNWIYASTFSNYTASFLFEVNNPAQPVLRQIMHTYRYFHNYNSSDNYLLAIDDGLIVSDITLPAYPDVISKYNEIQPKHLQTKDSLILIADDQTMIVLDMKSYQAPRLVDELSTLSSALGVHVVNGKAYIASDRQGLYIYDVSVPQQPAFLSKLHLFDYHSMYGVHVAGNYAYTLSIQTFDVFDITNPYQPKHVSLQAATGHVDNRYRALSINKLLMTGVSNSTNQGFAIYALDNPTEPQFGMYFPEQYELVVKDMALKNDRVFFVHATDTSSKLFSYLHSTTPGFQGKTEGSIAGGANGIEIVGNNAYISSSTKGLLIYDISNPATPKLLSETPMAGAQDIEVSNNLAYLSVGNDIQVIDVSSSSAPKHVATLRGNYPTRSLQVVGNIIYKGGSNGLSTYWYAPTTQKAINNTANTLTSSFDNTSYSFPAATFTSAVTVTHTPLLQAVLPQTTDLFAINHAFSLSATGVTGDSVAKDFTITVNYKQEEVRSAREATLALYRLEDGKWVKVANSTVDVANNKVTANTNKLGTYAVFGETYSIKVPHIQR